MKNNKGQALIEFILILPIILAILLYIIEFGRITIQKQQLEASIDLIVDLYEDGKKNEIETYIQNNNILINVDKQNDLTTLKINKKIKSNLPLINKIMGDSIETKRTIYEKQ